MAKKTGRKLALKKETLRALSREDLSAVVGGLASGLYCSVGNNSVGCGSETWTCTDDCFTVAGGSIIIKN